MNKTLQERIEILKAAAQKHERLKSLKTRLENTATKPTYQSKTFAPRKPKAFRSKLFKANH